MLNVFLWILMLVTLLLVADSRTTTLPVDRRGTDTLTPMGEAHSYNGIC